MIYGLAPMDGITDLPFRYICHQTFERYNTNPNVQFWTWTEFMNAEGYIRNPAGVIHHVVHLTDLPGQRLIAQIYGGDHEALLHTAIDIDKKYSDLVGIELNIGCPSPKVMSCGAGAGMMNDKTQTLHTIKTISQAIDTPFSIKTRSGLDQDDKPAQMEFILQASQYCFLISIHGRTFKQAHSGDNDRDYIHHVKTMANERCLIVGNGGIGSYPDIATYQHNLDGVMIGQSAIGNPWIFVDHEPTPQDRYETIIDHLTLAVAYEMWRNDVSGRTKEKNLQVSFTIPTINELLSYQQDILVSLECDDMSENFLSHVADLITPITFRKFLFTYIKTLPRSKELKQQVCQIKDLRSLYQAVREFFAKM